MRASASLVSGNISVNNIIAFLGEGVRAFSCNTPIKSELNISYEATQILQWVAKISSRTRISAHLSAAAGPNAAVAKGARLHAWRCVNIRKNALLAPNVFILRSGT